MARLSATIDNNPEVVRNIALLNEALPNTSIIVICDHEDNYQIGKALRQGIRGGALILPCALTELLSQQPIAPKAIEVMAHDYCGLTQRQREVLNLLQHGKQNKIIADELSVRESTVKVHVRQILRKMRVNNRTEAALLARQMQNENGSTHGRSRKQFASHHQETRKNVGKNGYK